PHDVRALLDREGRARLHADEALHQVAVRVRERLVGGDVALEVDDRLRRIAARRARGLPAARRARGRVAGGGSTRAATGPGRTAEVAVVAAGDEAEAEADDERDDESEAVHFHEPPFAGRS